MRLLRRKRAPRNDGEEVALLAMKVRGQFFVNFVFFVVNER